MKKTTILTVLCVVMALFLVQTVTAGSVTVNDVALGDNSQERSVPNSRDVADQNIRISKTITITNGDEAVDTVKIKLKSILFTTKYDFAFEINDVAVAEGGSVTLKDDGEELAAEESITFKLEAQVVADLDAVDAQLVEIAQDIAELELTAEAVDDNEVFTDTAKVTMQAENKLTIDDIEVCLNNDDCDSSIDDGDNVEDVKPGDRAEVQVRVENKFSDSRNSRVDIEDVEVRLIIDEDEIDEDLDEDVNSLNADDKDDVSFDFDIDDDANSDATVFVEVEGETEFGARMGETLNFDLEIERESHEMKLDAVSASPSVLICGSTQIVSVRATTRNIGKSDEDEVTLKLSSDRLGIQDQFIRNLEVDEDDRLTRTFSVTLPDGTKKGVYALSVESFYDRDEFSDSREVTITVPECASSSRDDDRDDDDDRSSSSDDDDNQDNSQDTPVVVVQQPPQPTVTTQPPVASPQPTPTPARKSSGSNVVVGVLVAVIVLLLIVGVILIVAMARKPKRPHHM